MILSQDEKETNSNTARKSRKGMRRQSTFEPKMQGKIE
jgi:hypothetical protein